MDQFRGPGCGDNFKMRREQRCQLRIPALLRLEQGQEISFDLRDLSTQGFSGHSSHVVRINSPVALFLPNMEAMPARAIWQLGSATGGQFLTPLPVRQIISILLHALAAAGGTQAYAEFAHVRKLGV
jgi:hypothetical protein